MNIGDEVRFLNEVGGGKVVAFRDKNVVLVKNEDGFEIPMLINEVVVVKSDSYDRKFKDGRHIAVTGEDDAPAKRNAASPAAAHGAQDSQKGAGTWQTAEQGWQSNATVSQKSTPRVQKSAPQEAPAFRPMPLERREGEKLNIFLAFVPTDADNMVDTTFDAYIVNDSNYYITLSLLAADGAAWRARFEGTLEPNTKFFVEELERAQLDEIARVALQMIAYKREKPFGLKPAISVELRVDGSKFYKPGAFKANDFFAEPALIYNIVCNDVPERGIFVDAGEIRDALLGKDAPAEPKHRQPKARRDDTLEVDLHAHALLDSTDGLKNSEIMARQLAEVRETMERHRRQKGKRIVFIHGKGDGVLRAAVLKELKLHYPACRTQDASFQEYGFGATLVVIG